MFLVLSSSIYRFFRDAELKAFDMRVLISQYEL
jgi:hypothetical protein